MAIKLHRCSLMWVKIGAHPCWKVQKALDDAGIEYEVVKGPMGGRGKRTELEAAQRPAPLPGIEFEDGSVYREQSKQMAETIEAGKLDEKRAAGSASSG